MATEVQPQTVQHVEKVHSLFSAIAERYDVINDVQSFGLHRRWKRRLAELAGVGPGQLALDVCCGTGDVAFALARRGAQVIGIDFSRAMIEQARRRQQCCVNVLCSSGAGPANPAFVLGDALELPFPDNTFDAATNSYGLRNLVSWERGLQEMIRVVKHGGRVLVLDFGKPANRLLRAIYFGYVRLALPALGGIIAGNAAAYRYVMESLARYPAQQVVQTKMRELGLDCVRVFDLVGGVMSISLGTKPC
ncbi:MAG: class I SAM-dependent methyltransferase [Verrucomicrobiae bacterium]|nr:class I SAM-dependent methyltransferase [Verrucomicrobiae bacterium]MDW7980501.1 class I SAM-dependent methyltransferase [Verrucomicrobiales bacterium]